MLSRLMAMDGGRDSDRFLAQMGESLWRPKSSPRPAARNMDWAGLFLIIGRASSQFQTIIGPNK
jgi:hypothetical protein